MTNETPDGFGSPEPAPRALGPRGDRDPGPVDALIVYLIAILYVVGVGFLLRQAANRWLDLVFPVGIGAIPLAFARFRGIAPSRAFPLSVPAPRQTIGALLMSVGTLCGFVFVSFLLTAFFPDFGGTSGASAERLLSAGLPYNLLFVGLLPAISEELLCRGLILSGLRRSLSRWPSIALCSLMFALLHMEPLSVPFTFAAALAIAWVAVETSSLILPVLMHLLHNLALYFVIAGVGSGFAGPGQATVDGFPIDPATIGALAFAAAASAILLAVGSRLVRRARP